MKSRALILTAVLVGSATNAHAFTVLHNFGTPGKLLNPGFEGIFAQGRDGNLDSTISNGA
jgi:hypothetical protein